MRLDSIESIEKNSLLYDFYGQLLSSRQQEVMALYHEENLSLSEIAAEFGISRQAVHDTLKKAEQALTEYEDKLGLVERLESSKRVIAGIDEKIDELISLLGGQATAPSAEAASSAECASGTGADCNTEIVRKLEEIKTVISELE